MDSLAASEQDALNEFVTITDVSLDDDEITAKAIALLSRHSFNLNNAVLAYFDSGLDAVEPQSDPFDEALPIGEESSASGLERFESSAIHRNLQSEFAMDSFLPRLLKAPRITNAWQFDLGVYLSRKSERDLKPEGDDYDRELLEKTVDAPRRSSILWILLLVIPKALSFVFSLIRSILGLNYTSALYKKPRSKFDYDDYEENYELLDKINEDTSIYNISSKEFNRCHEASQNNYNFLLIVLVDDSSVGFANGLLQAEQFKSLVHKETGTYKDTQIFVGNIEKSPEAFEVARTYKTRKIPYVTLVGNVSNNHAVMASMSIIYKANCSIGDDEETNTLIAKLIRNLNNSMGSYNPQLVTKRFDKQEIELSRMLREKQDEAYLESLESDKIKKIEKENKLKLEENNRMLQDLRNAYLSNLVRDNYFDKAKDAPPRDCIRVSIKLPDGRRIIQKFFKSVPVAEVYLFVQTQLFDEKCEIIAQPVDITVAEYVEKFNFDFDLFKPLPKVNLPPSMQTIEEFGLLKTGDNILVEFHELQ